jgi:NADP+-dependent farnesol dehydrogenase
MERLAGRVVVVTGASGGIGSSLTQELVKKGLNVVGLARKVEKIQVRYNNIQRNLLWKYPRARSNDEGFFK